VDKSWVDCDRATVKRSYDRLAKFIPLFDRLLFLPPGLRRSAVEHLRLRAGARVLEIDCGTGIALAYLSDAVGPAGCVYGVDSEHAATGTDALRRRAPAQCGALRMRRRRLCRARTARRRVVLPVLQHHAAPSGGIAPRLEGAAAGRPACHHGWAAALRAFRQMAVAVQRMADETHDAGQSADPAVA